MKVRKWRSIFNLGRSGHETKRKVLRGAEDRGKSGEMDGGELCQGRVRPWLYAHPSLAEDKSDKGTLRPAKSMDSLSAAAGACDGEYRCALLCVCGGGGGGVGAPARAHAA